MHEILESLPGGSRVLDLGSREGSFPRAMYPLHVVRVDLDRPTHDRSSFVQATATQLPFASQSFDAVILNHSVEHFTGLKPALQEIGRVLRKDGALYVAVPNARTLSDRMYRKIYKQAGGHVNLFDSAARLGEMLSWYSGMKLVAVKTLYSGFVFWNPANISKAARGMMRVPPLWEPLLAILAAAARLADHWCGTHASEYGWAFYFGAIGQPVESQTYPNVCIRCGLGNSEFVLRRDGRVNRRLLFERYTCPACGARNFLLPGARHAAPNQG